MNKNIFWIFIASSILLTACSKDCKKCRGGNTGSPIPLENIHSVKINFAGTVYIYQEDYQMVSVVGPETAIKNINTGVKDGEWDLHFPQCLECEEKVEVNIIVPNIKNIELAGSGKVILENSIRQNEISIIHSGSGSIRVDDLKVDSLYTKLSGSGNVHISGEGARVIESELSGSGDLELYQFPGVEVRSKLTGSGNIFTTVIDILKAWISGSGNVYYKGSPAIEKDVTGSGNVIKG